MTQVPASQQALSSALFLHTGALAESLGAVLRAVTTRDLQADPLNDAPAAAAVAGFASVAYVVPRLRDARLLHTSYDDWLDPLRSSLEHTLETVQLVATALRDGSGSRGADGDGRGGKVTIVWEEPTPPAGPTVGLAVAGALTSMVKALGRDFSRDAVSINGVVLPPPSAAGSDSATRILLASAVSTATGALTGQILRASHGRADISWGAW